MNNINTVLTQLKANPQFSAPLEDIFFEVSVCNLPPLLLKLNYTFLLSDIKNIMQKLMTLLICHIDTPFYLFIFFFGVSSFKIRASLIKIFIAFLINFGIRIPAQLTL